MIRRNRKESEQQTVKQRFGASWRLLQKIVVPTGVGLLMLLSGCSTIEYHATETVYAHQRSSAVGPDSQLLDVSIALFDPGIDLLEEAAATYSSIRQSEAVWYSTQLKNALEYSNAWGVVRITPSQHLVSDLQVTGKILVSNGEALRLQIDVVDAAGTQWLSKEYFYRVSAYAYNPEFDFQGDPFQGLFNLIANDLFDLQANYDAIQLARLRQIAKIRFAYDFAPAVFQDYLTQDQQGSWDLQRMPASNDPMLTRISRIQQRNDFFIDVVQDYYRTFHNSMQGPYTEWRKLSYREVLYERQLKVQSKKEKVAGVIALLVGIAAQTSNNPYTRGAGHIGILGGAKLFRSGYVKADEAIAHAETLHELGASLEAELQPVVIDLRDRSITLSGTVEDQFKEWRRILADMFVAEQGGINPSLEAAESWERDSEQTEIAE